ncbi:MAG TPA: hypothetical protein DCS07_03600 [Bdellovibrionales bacterium]|nr:MAG: hypothetical protein A2Z97_12215 [Bdellovibrionales bacterium GWB1_52_6]OFZ03706.1 MAG: hypothetical protein A2X97_14195 [Bdellovibrionales bacterium GWA1_52_35]OFZ41144.1 MAG: hypothetical protein A2070_08760 [Bdellovibrionales bacterium GWC1_52_8]HAR41703.1 hypothetical protein [Bdellovibrionales bacterium]HCM38782.1 hypothetical protein [Bdellovibrionales bacterium]
MVADVLQILIVEDIASMRELLVHTFEGMRGFAVSGTAGNGWEARIELSRRRPDLILLDEILPGESAEDLLQQFAQEGIPVILLTSVAQPSHVLPALAKGRVQKPSWNSIDQYRPQLQEQILKMLGRHLQ